MALRRRFKAAVQRGRRRCPTFLAFVALLLLISQPSSAHDGVADQIARLSAQIIRDPANASLLCQRGELYGAAHQFNEALADLDAAGRIDPTMDIVDVVRAHVFLDAGNPRAAADAASRVLIRRPGDVRALVVRGRARAQSGSYGDAVIDFTRALDVNATPDLYVERARTVVAVGQAQVETAIRGLDEGIRRLGPIASLELEAIRLEMQMGEYDAALTRLDSVAAQAARKESWLARRGAILEAAGRKNEARAAYAAALAAAVNSPRPSAGTPTLIEQLRGNLARLDTRRIPRRKRTKGDT